MGQVMWAWDATHILEHAADGFWFRSAHDDGALEIGVYYRDRYVGRLEHGFMDDKRHVEVMFAPGREWKEGDEHFHRRYWRDDWKSCLGRILLAVPEYVKERVVAFARKRGFRL